MQSFCSSDDTNLVSLLSKVTASVVFRLFYFFFNNSKRMKREKNIQTYSNFMFAFLFLYSFQHKQHFCHVKWLISWLHLVKLFRCVKLLKSNSNKEEEENAIKTTTIWKKKKKAFCNHPVGFWKSFVSHNFINGKAFQPLPRTTVKCHQPVTIKKIL